MNRRDLLLLRVNRDKHAAELSCERLYIHYQHAKLTMDRPAQPPAPGAPSPWSDSDDAEPPTMFDERTTQQLFHDIDLELRNADVVRVVDTGWLAVDAFRRDVEDLLTAFRRRGGRVEYPRHVPISHG